VPWAFNSRSEGLREWALNRVTITFVKSEGNDFICCDTLICILAHKESIEEKPKMYT
jgi:hypothetical protein